MTLSVMRDRTEACASDLQLDEMQARSLGEPDEVRLRDHVEHCARCQARRSSIERVAPLVPDTSAFARRLASDAVRTPARRRFYGAAGALAATAAGVALFISLRGSAPEIAREQTKGTLALTAYIRRPDGRIDCVSHAGRLSPGDEMRFAIATGRPGFVAVLGLDARPSVTVYVPVPPAGALSRVERAGQIALPGSIVADDTLGFERVSAVVCDTAPSLEWLRQKAESALAAANGRPEVVSSLETGCLEGSVLLHKDRR